MRFVHCSFDQFLFAPTDFQADGSNTAGSGGPNMSVADEGDDYDSNDSDDSDGDDKKRKRPRNQQRYMTEEQRVERRCVPVLFFFLFLSYLLTTYFTNEQGEKPRTCQAFSCTKEVST